MRTQQIHQSEPQQTRVRNTGAAQNLINAMKAQNLDRAVIVTSIDPNYGAAAVVDQGATFFQGSNSPRKQPEALPPRGQP